MTPFENYECHMLQFGNSGSNQWFYNRYFRKEMFDITPHSTHFIYSYMVSATLSNVKCLTDMCLNIDNCECMCTRACMLK